MKTIIEPGAGAIDRDEVVEAWAALVPICDERLARGLPKRLATARRHRP